jgi:hypothetical protein
MEPGRRHCSAECQEHGTVLLGAASHKLVRSALLPANVGRKSVLEDLLRRLSAGDGPRVDFACALEVAPKGYIAAVRIAYGHDDLGATCLRRAHPAVKHRLQTTEKQCIPWLR